MVGIDKAGWIAVTDKLPDEAGRYPVIVMVGSMAPKEKITTRRFCVQGRRSFFAYSDWQTVTHWKQPDREE